MQNVSDSPHRSSDELLLLDALINEQNKNSDQTALPINVINRIRDYLKASGIVLILLDLENPEWATKKVLGAKQTWQSEGTFLIKKSILCNSIPQDIISIDQDS